MVDTGQRRPRIMVGRSYAVGLVMHVARIPARGGTVLGRDFQPMDAGQGPNPAPPGPRLGAEAHAPLRPAALAVTTKSVPRTSSPAAYTPPIVASPVTSDSTSKLPGLLVFSSGVLDGIS